jgi:hypothetical protein
MTQFPKTGYRGVVAEDVAQTHFVLQKLVCGSSSRAPRGGPAVSSQMRARERARYGPGVKMPPGQRGEGG